MDGQTMTWKEYFAELVRVAIDKGYAEDYDLFDMGMEGHDSQEEWESYCNKRDSAFYALFGEEF